MSDIFIKTQVITDRNRNVFGHSLFLGNDPVRRLAPPAHERVSPVVLFDALNDPDLERMLSSETKFVPVDDDFLISPLLESLNKKAIVFQLHGKVVVDADFVGHCKRLSEQGYQLCLEPGVQGQGITPFHSFCKFVKVDVSGQEWSDIGECLQALKIFDVQAIATPTNTKEDFDRCVALGFDLFEGNFFARAPLRGRKAISPSQTFLMELSNAVIRNDDIQVVERLFKGNPELTFGLLKLINSPFFQLRQKISSVRQAITLLGYDNLQKWVTLLMFSVDWRNSRRNPLFEKAVLRGRLMEMLAEKCTGNRVLADSAFVTGILSLADALFQTSLEDVVGQLNVSQEIRDALIGRTGLLGTLLLLCGALDDEEYGVAGECLARLGLEVRDLWALESRAILEYEKSNEAHVQS